MPVLFIETEPRFQALIGISHLSQDSSAHSRRAAQAGVIGFLALSAIIITLTSFCVFVLRNRRVFQLNSRTMVNNTCDESNISRFHSTGRQCLRRIALINATKKASPPSSRLRPLLLGRPGEHQPEQQAAIKERQDRQKQKNRATLLFLTANRPMFPFSSPSTDRNVPILRQSQSWPGVQRTVHVLDNFIRRHSEPGKPIKEGFVRKDELTFDFTSRKVAESNPVHGARAAELDLARTEEPTDTPFIVIQQPTPPRFEKYSSRKGSKISRRPRPLRLLSVQDARKRHTTRQRTRKPPTALHQEIDDNDDPFIIPERRIQATLKKQAKHRAKPGKRNNGHASKRPSKASLRKYTLSSPRKPLGNLTNTSLSPFKTPPRAKPLLHINGIPTDEPKTPPQMVRTRSPPKNRAYLSTRWKPRPPRPSLTITVFIKERASRALYPGRRLTVTPSAGTSLAELKKEIAKAAGHEVGILKGMTLVGHTTMNVPLMSDRFYGQWVKERVAEGGAGVIEVTKVDR